MVGCERLTTGETPRAIAGTGAKAVELIQLSCLVLSATVDAHLPICKKDFNCPFFLENCQLLPAGHVVMVSKLDIEFRGTSITH